MSRKPGMTMRRKGANSMAIGPNKNTKEAVKRRAEAIIDKIIRGGCGENLITISADLLPDTFSAK